MRSFEESELELLRELVLLPILLSVFERHKKVINESELSIKRPYIDIIDAAMDRVIKDISRLKKEAYKKRLKVAKENRTDIGLDCIFLCRGYSQSFQMLWDFVKAETEVRMRKYLLNSHS